MSSCLINSSLRFVTVNDFTVEVMFLHWCVGLFFSWITDALCQICMHSYKYIFYNFDIYASVWRC